MGERITFRRNEGLITVKPYWRGNPVVKGRFVNRQHRSKHDPFTPQLHKERIMS